MVDREYYYPRNETRYLFTPEKEKHFVQQFNDGKVTQFKDQASAILRIRYYNPQNVIFQPLLIKAIVILDRQRFKDDNRLSNGYITQLLKFLISMKMLNWVGKYVIFTKEFYTERIIKSHLLEKL